MVQTTRRRLVIGGLALSISSTAAGAEPAHGDQTDAELLALGSKFERLRRRARRLQRRVQHGDDTPAWSRWSLAVDDCAELCEVIARSPADSIAGLAVRYHALLWELTEDDIIMDRAVQRRAIAFGRLLSDLAGRASAGRRE